MTFWLLVPAAVVIVLCLLRWNKLRRDHGRYRPPLVWPADPTRPSGIRLVNDDYRAPAPETIERPRLDPTRSYVFSESGDTRDPLVPATSSGRERWALNHSATRSWMDRGSLKLLTATITVLVTLVVVGSLLATR